MTPSILIAGATGNTGQSLVSTLPSLLASHRTLSNHRILALTRDPTTPTAQRLAQIPGVTILQKNWVEITPQWLTDHNVTRAFIASHNAPNQFAEESTFHLAALNAGVQYVVRISTTAENVRPDCKAYYPRSHWAIETLLDSPAFEGLQWTSLQPNAFSPLWLYPAVEFVKRFRETGGQQGTLRLMAAEEAPAGIVDPYDVGVLAAYLLAQEDVSAHHRGRYVVNGPEDVTGREIVEMVEREIGTEVKDVRYRDMSFLDVFYESQYAATKQSRNVIFSIEHAVEPVWEGKCSAQTTSPEVLEVAAPKRGPADVWKMMLGG